MIFYSKRSTNCLFCNTACDQQLPPQQDEVDADAPSKSQSETDKESHEDEDGLPKESKSERRKIVDDAENFNCSCHEYPPSFLGALSWKWEEKSSDRFLVNLKYAFLLRQLLDYPKTKCVQYLKQRWKIVDEGDGEEEQDGWFTVCEKCSKLVEEGHDMYHKIEELENKLDELKRSLKEMLISSHNDNQNNVEEEGCNWDETICSEVRNHFVPRTPIDQSIVKMEVDMLAQTESDANSDFVNDDDGADDAMNESNSSESEWAPSEEAEEDTDNIDVKPDLATLITSKDPSQEITADEGGINEAETLISLKETDGNDTMPRSRLSRRTLRTRKSKVVNRIGDHEPEDLAEIEGADETDEDDDSPKVKKKRKVILSDTESDPMSDEESDNEKGGSSAKEQFSCSICGVIYQTQHRAREHEEVHKRDDVFKCKSCKFVCLTSRGLKIHNTKVHSTSEPSEKSKVKKKIKREYEDVDNEEAGDHSCSLCPVVYKTAHRLKEHEEVHQMENVYRCQVCGFACLKSRGLRIHARKYHSKLLNWNEIFDDDLKYNEVDSAVAEPNETSEAEYSCATCCAVYKTKHRLREHKRFHKMDDAVKCPECPYACMTERQLFAHSNKQHSKSDEPASDSKQTCAKSKNSSAPFQCILCPAKYQSENRFKQHSALHNDDSSFNCEVCGWVLATKEKLKYHMMFNHKKKLGKGAKAKRLRPKDGPYKCDHCPALYGTRNAFRNHVYDNHKDKLVQCKECDRCFESKQLLELHIQKKPCNAADMTESDGDTAETKKVHSCQQCSSSFKSQSKLRAHIAERHEKKEFPCSVCSAVFPTESRYKFHMSRMHDKIHNVCKTCGYKAHGASHLRLHMQKHTKQKMYMCEICSKTFTSPTYLTGHKQKEHFQELGVQPIKCEECDVLLPSRAQLKYHNQKVHEKKFKYFCEICGKGFLFESGLKNHSQIHSTERNEVCQICGAAYVHNRVLMDHMKNHHPEIYAASKGKDPADVSTPNLDNQGPFNCKFCNKEFSMRYHLHSHLKTHTEVYEKYKCGICGKGYSSVSGVKRHEESAHQSASYSCQYCGKEFPCRDYVRYHVKNHCRKKEATTEKSDDHEETKHGPTPTEPIIVSKAGQLHVVAPSTTAAVDSSNEFILSQQSAAQQPQPSSSSGSSFTHHDTVVNDFANPLNPFLRSFYQSNYK